MNKHDFEMRLPFLPTEEPEKTYIRMDGKELKGITSVRVQAGVDGFTNVVLQMDAPVLVEMVAALLIHVQNHDFFQSIFDKVAEEYSFLNDLNLDGCDKTDLVVKMLTMTIEHSKTLR